LVDAIDAIDHQLIALQAPEVAADDYARFVRQWFRSNSGCNLRKI
jgi:hypothetical protein